MLPKSYDFTPCAIADKPSVMVRKGILDLGDITKSFKHVEYPAR
jgi:hypothetical protein